MDDKLYMAITADRYELPVAVADNTASLAKIFRMAEKSLASYLSRGSVKQIGPNEYIRFVAIVLDADED